MKKLKTVIIIWLSIVILVGAVGLFIFNQEWNWKGYSNYLGIDPWGSAGLTLLAENEETSVYTYHIGICSIKKIGEEKPIPLKDLLFDEVTVEDLTRKLKNISEDGVQGYEAEGYKIYVMGKNYVITTDDVTADTVQAKLGKH